MPTPALEETRLLADIPECSLFVLMIRVSIMGRDASPPDWDVRVEARSKLTVEQVLEARLLHAQSGLNLKHLAKQYGVSPKTLENAVLGRTFRSVPMPPKGLQF